MEQNKSIIIIEDDPFTQQFYKYLFAKTNYKTEIFEEGDRLADMLENEVVNLVIMDINLKNTYLKDKKVDGIFLSKYIKNNDKTAGIPVLLVTAYQKTPSANNYFDDSLADDYIVKPIVDYNDLLDKVKSLIEKN
jgi:CheY-like chemotaxis protein